MGMYGGDRYQDRPSGPPRSGWPPVPDAATAHTAAQRPEEPPPAAGEHFSAAGVVFFTACVVILLTVGAIVWMALP